MSIQTLNPLHLKKKKKKIVAVNIKFRLEVKFSLDKVNTKS